jgi:Zn-dependent protease
MGVSSLLTAALLGMVWGSTPVQPANFRSRFGDAFVSASGPLVNLLLAAFSLSALGLWMNAHGQDAIHLPLDERDNLHLFLFVFGWWNVALAIFNLIPVPPLDGASVLGSFVPSFGRLARQPEVQPWGFAVMVLVVMVTPLFTWAKAISVAFVGWFVT